MDGTLEAIECHGPIALGDSERLVIVITADITLSHGTLLSKHGVSPHNGQQPGGFHVRGARLDQPSLLLPK